MTLILQVFYSVFSGLLLTLGIPNELFLLGNPFYAFISIIPYYIAIKNAKSYKQAFLLGFVQTLTTHLASSFWLAYFKDFAIFTLGASAAATACIGGIMALFIYLPFSHTEASPLSIFSASRPFYKNPAFRILYFSALYTLYEWVKSSGFIGYPWGTISSAMYRWHSFTQLAAITGTYGITFLTVMFDSLIAEAACCYIASLKLLKEQRLDFYAPLINTGKVFGILFAITLFWGSWEYNKPRTPDKLLSTVMVQQNYNPWLTDNDEETILLSEELTQKKIDEQEKIGKKPQLIVWSEGSLQRQFPSAGEYYSWSPSERPLLSFLKSNGIPFLTGGVYRKTIPAASEEESPHYKYFNVALMFDSSAKFRGYYGKLHLVPFAESIPGIENPVIKKIFKKVVGISAGWTAGEQLAYFEIPCSYYDKETIPRVNNINIAVPYEVQKRIKEPLVRIATPVCFDDSFTDVIRPLFLNGAELFVNLTDDSWSRKKSSEYQHFCIASYRAIEYRTTFVRSTNAGYSVVISPSGAVLADQPLFEDSALAYDVPVYKREITPYARFGNWLPYSCLVFFFIVAVISCCSFTTDDSIPSERKHKITLKKAKKAKKSKKTSKKKKHK